MTALAADPTEATSSDASLRHFLHGLPGVDQVGAEARAATLGTRALSFLATAPIAIPGITLGVGLFLAYTRGPVVLYGTLWILLLAYVTIELPAAYQQLQAAFRGISGELEEASRILGASRLGTLRRVTAPLLGPSLVATWCFIFVAVMRELSLR